MFHLENGKDGPEQSVHGEGRRNLETHVTSASWKPTRQAVRTQR